MTASKVIKENQTKFLKIETRFAKKFCSACLTKYSSPTLFKECQHKSCKNPLISKATLKPDLELSEKLAPNKFKLCKVPIAVFCQFCRNAKLDEVEKRVLNLLLDRQLQGKSIGLVPSQRTARPENLKENLMPLAIAIFPVVSKNIRSYSGVHVGDLSFQLQEQLVEENQGGIQELLIHRNINDELTETEKNKYRQFNKIELDLRKLIFQEKALQSLLFNKERFLREGLTFKATQFTDEHLAGLLKMDFKQEQLQALQRSMKKIIGIKLTSNLKKNLKSARNIGLNDAGCGGEITCGQFETAKFWKYQNIKLTCELLIRRAKQKALFPKGECLSTHRVGPLG